MKSIFQGLVILIALIFGWGVLTSNSHEHGMFSASAKEQAQRGAEAKTAEEKLLSEIAARKEILIPRSMPGDKGKYYLLSSKIDGGVISSLHKRVGVDSIGYTMTETNCLTMQMRELGYSEDSPQRIKQNPTRWFDLVPGSSKSDLANFVCKKIR